MHKLDALCRPGEDHTVVADYRAATQRGKADIAGAAHAGVAVTRTHRALLEVDTAALRRRAPEHECGSRGGVDLLVVVHLEDLDIEVFPKRFRDALDQRLQHIDAHAEVAGFDDDSAPAGRADQLLVFAAQPGGADDMHDCRPGGQLSEGNAGRGNGEVEQPVRLGEQWLEFGSNGHVVLAKPGQFAGVAADDRRPRRIHRTRERHAIGRRNRVHEAAPHAPAGPSHDQPHVGHSISPAGGIAEPHCSRRTS